MESFVTQAEFELKNERGVREIYIPAGIEVSIRHVSGEWFKLQAGCFITSTGNTEVMLGSTQIKKLRGE